MAKAKTDLEKKTTDLCKELFELAGLDAKVKVGIEEGEDSPIVNLDVETTKDAGLLIGKRGETLAAIQSFLALALKQETGDWVRIVVNVGDWRERQEERLMSLANQAAERARSTGQSQVLYNLTPVQRRIVHLALKDNDSVETESEGEGSERYLVVKPK